MFKALLDHMIAEHGLPATATEADARKLACEKMASGAMSHEKYVELTVGAQRSAGIEKLGALIGDAVKTSVEPLTKRLDSMERYEPVVGRVSNSAIDRLNSERGSDDVGEAEKFLAGGASRQTTGGVRVKRASEMYSTTKSAATFPTMWKHNVRHPLAGQPVVLEGRGLDMPSQRDLAFGGALFKWKIAHQLNRQHELSDHDIDLFNEALREGRWSGTFKSPDGVDRVLDRAILDPQWVKVIYADATSGGSNLILQVMEEEIIRQALLFGELMPWVTIRNLDKGTSVDINTLVNLTITNAADETTAMSAQSTASLLSKANSAVRAKTGVITLGRDFIADSTPDIMAAVNASYSEQLQANLDDGIANGNGTTDILGIFNASSTNTVTNASPSPTGWDVVDVENMVKGLPKQYRNPSNPNVRWGSNDTTYFRVRGMKVSSTDERRIFGYTHEDYRVLDRGWSIQNSIANTKVFFGDLKRYWLWRRLGMEMITDESGSINRLANQVMVIIRSRWAGRPVLPQAFAVMTTAPA